MSSPYRSAHSVGPRQPKQKLTLLIIAWPLFVLGPLVAVGLVAASALGISMPKWPIIVLAIMFPIGLLGATVCAFYWKIHIRNHGVIYDAAIIDVDLSFASQTHNQIRASFTIKIYADQGIYNQSVICEVPPLCIPMIQPGTMVKVLVDPADPRFTIIQWNSIKAFEPGILS